MPEPRPLSLSRLENLTDGVFGFAMTLFVLGLGVDEAYALLQAGDLRGGLVAMAPRFLTMAFGIFGLGAFWVAHNVAFRFVERVDRELTFMNLLTFLFVILLPFSTAVWGRAWSDPLALTLMAANVALINATMWLLWAYIVRARERNGVPIDERHRRNARYGFLLPNVAWAGVIALAFLWPPASAALFVLSTLSYSLPKLSRWAWRPRR